MYIIITIIFGYLSEFLNYLNSNEHLIIIIYIISKVSNYLHNYFYLIINLILYN